MEIVVVDTETTGLSKDAKIIQIAGIRFEGKIVLECFPSNLIDPGEKIPEKVSKIHGIKDHHIKGMPTVEEVLPDFLDFCGKEITFLGHNVDFDLGMIKKACQRKAIRFPNQYKKKDTLDIAKEKVNLINYKLPTLAKFYRIKQEGFHDALTDCFATMQLYWAMERK